MCFRSYLFFLHKNLQCNVPHSNMEGISQLRTSLERCRVLTQHSTAERPLYWDYTETSCTLLRRRARRYWANWACHARTRAGDSALNIYVTLVVCDTETKPGYICYIVLKLYLYHISFHLSCLSNHKVKTQPTLSICRVAATHCAWDIQNCESVPNLFFCFVYVLRPFVVPYWKRELFLIIVNNIQG